MRFSTPLTYAAFVCVLVAAHGFRHADGVHMRALASGDWEFCSFSSECANGCCSKQYSGDGRLKCTPGGSHDQCVSGGGVAKPTTQPSNNGRSTPQPTNRPTPVPTRPAVPPPPPPNAGWGDWEFCSQSPVPQQLLYSDDGKLKCTPGGSRDQCV